MIPELYTPDDLDDYRKKEMHKIGIYCPVSVEWIKRMVDKLDLKGKTILETFAGTGIVSKALMDQGVQCIATDSGEWDIKYRMTNVIKLSACEAIVKYRDDVDILLMCWPPPDHDSFVAARAWGPQKPIIYIGEYNYVSCTASDKFMMHFRPEKYIEYPTYSHHFDMAYLGRYVTEEMDQFHHTNFFETTMEEYYAKARRER